MPNAKHPKPKEGGKKFDSQKLRLELIPPEAIEGLGSVLTFGAGKYGDRNWQNGIRITRLIGSLKRHLLKFEKSIDVDDESGCLEIDHILTNAAMIKWMIVNRIDMDDRYVNKIKRSKT